MTLTTLNTERSLSVIADIIINVCVVNQKKKELRPKTIMYTFVNVVQYAKQ